MRELCFPIHGSQPKLLLSAIRARHATVKVLWLWFTPADQSARFTEGIKNVINMSHLYPRQETLQSVFSNPILSSRSRGGASPYQARSELYGAWSVVDDAKNKAQKLSAEAAKEFEKASAKAQSKTGKIELYSGKYYAACTVGGLMACVSRHCLVDGSHTTVITNDLAQGLTHTAVTPLDLVKTRRQIDSKLYKSNFQAWGMIYRTEGIRGIFTGWSPTFFGYSAQGAFKYGWYEFFKKTYSDLAGAETAYKYKTSLYLAASASAEFLADIALCPFEAVKVRMQGSIPAPYTGTLDGISKITAKEGVAGLYKGIYPLWGRQIPYTMMKFASFETIVEMIYERLPGQKSDYSKAAQTGVSFVGGYLAGILCAIVSHPADVMVSKLNANRAQGEAFGAAMGRIYKEIGFGGLWNGLPVRIVMIGTLTGLQWMIYVSAFWL
jgi:solute carrier family 25 (mitochondrial phosphate transporter), member 3